MTPRFCTIGHSNRTLGEFIDILRTAEVGLVVDVRSFPRSRSNPDYNSETLPERLADYQIGYRHIPALGGRRKLQPEVPDELNARWRNRSFYNYADYALSAEFASAFRGTGRARSVAAAGDDVLRSCLVAVPLAHHQRLPAPWRPRCGAPDGKRPRGAGQGDTRRGTYVRGEGVYPAGAETS